MSIFSNKPRTAAQKAQGEKTRLIFRAAILVLLVFYLVLPLIRAYFDGEDYLPTGWQIAIIIFFVIAIGALSAVTINDYIKGKKSGRFDPEFYKDDEPK